MNIILKSTISSIALISFLATPVFADDRELIKMPEKVQVKFLGEMRSLVESLDEMLEALAEGDFDTVSKIADFKLGFQHGKWQKMLANGKSEAEVQAKINSMRENLQDHKPGQGPGKGKGKGKGKNKGKGLDRFLPEAAHDMAKQMHAAASELSVAAQSAGKNPDLAKYTEVLDKIQGITTMCVSCHTGYKIR